MYVCLLRCEWFVMLHTNLLCSILSYFSCAVYTSSRLLLVLLLPTMNIDIDDSKYHASKIPRNQRAEP